MDEMETNLGWPACLLLTLEWADTIGRQRQCDVSQEFEEAMAQPFYTHTHKAVAEALIMGAIINVGNTSWHSVIICMVTHLVDLAAIKK
jgi:hypothetical protein